MKTTTKQDQVNFIKKRLVELRAQMAKENSNLKKAKDDERSADILSNIHIDRAEIAGQIKAFKELLDFLG